MFLSKLLFVLFCLVLMMAGLMLAAWAGRLQAMQYQTLRQLAALDQRRLILQDTTRALQRMDTDPAVLSVLFDALIQDLRRMIELDSSRKDLEKQLQETELASKQKSAPQQNGGSAAVATEQELIVAQRHIQRGLHAVEDLYRAGRITASQFDTCRSRLRVLGLRVAVNSCLLMAQQALEQEDTIRAMSCYRRAESLLHMRGMPADEKQEKLAYIDAERQRVFQQSQMGRGVLALASEG